MFHGAILKQRLSRRVVRRRHATKKAVEIVGR
jgi:hypothetical protein